MMTMESFVMEGETVRLDANRWNNGKCIYSLTLSKCKTCMSLDELSQICKVIRDEIDSIAYTSPVDGHTYCSPEIERFEEASKNAHRADADGADGA